MSIIERLQHSWNVFMNKDPTGFKLNNIGPSYSYRPDRPRITRGNERTTINAIINRIAMDVANITIQHVKLDDNNRYTNGCDTGLNYCLGVEANIDQTARAFIQDIVISLLDDGVVAVVPVDTERNPNTSGITDIYSMRTAKILEWFPRHVRVRIYNDKTGDKEDILVLKSNVAIIENPLYALMNEPNSTAQRLIRKISLLDAIDEQSGAGKLDLIIQLPYAVKSEARRAEAEKRRQSIEEQLAGTKYGIAYTDATEHITQLNRSVDNNLMKQVEYLTSTLHSQLGITTSIMDGSADTTTLNNYYTRLIEPIASAIVDEFNRKFLTREQRANKEAIRYFRDPFKLMSVNEIADTADKMTRNEIMSSNEFRQLIGLKPSKDPGADELRNKNLNKSSADIENQNEGSEEEIPKE